MLVFRSMAPRTVADAHGESSFTLIRVIFSPQAQHYRHRVEKYVEDVSFSTFGFWW